MELVSIVVPVYNVEKYVEQCLMSLIAQTYKNIEVIVINDGSTDNSKNICQRIALQDNRIKIYDKKNAGLGLARNTGLKYVSGKYVTFIDSDDYAEKDLIEKLYSTLKDNNADTCIGGFKRVNDDDEILFAEKYEEVIYSEEEVSEKLLARMMGSSPEKSDSIRMSVWSVLYSMDIIRNYELEFPSERKYISEDIMFDLEYYRYSRKCVVINSTLYNYRVNQTSLTMIYKEDRFDKHKFLYEEIAKKIKQYKLDNEFLVRLQRQFFVNVRVCIRQEKKDISKKNSKDSVERIRQICNDKLLQDILKSYPINKLPKKQRIFIYLIKFSNAKVLYCFANKGIF